MKLATLSFRGMAPRITPRALPDNASQEAINARLLTGDLGPWQRPELVEQLANAGIVRSIFPLEDIWLSYTEDVEFARGAVLDDDADTRVYITGLDAPRFTTYDLATASGSGAYPRDTRLLGVPAPSTDPLVEVTVAPPDESNITLTNPGAEAGNTSGWTITSGGLVAIEDGDIPGLDAQTGDWFFGGGAAAATAAYQSINLESLGVIAGQGLSLTWWQARGANSSLAGMSLEFYDDAAALLSTVASDQIAAAALNTWEQRTLTTQVPDGAATARLVQNYTRVGGGDIDAYIDTIAISSIAYTNSFDGTSLSGWTVSPNEGGVTSTIFRRVEIDTTFGRPASSFRMRGDSRVPYFFRDFSTDRSPDVTLQFDYYELLGRTNCGLHAVLFGSAGGAATSVFFSSWVGVRLYTNPEWGAIGASVEQIAPSLPAARWYTVTLTARQTSETSAQLTIRVINADTGEVVVDDEQTTISVDGPNIGFKVATNFEDRRYWVDNVSVTVAAPDPNQNDETTYTSYVYTFVNEFGEESAPSDPSDTVQRNANATAIITTPDHIPTGVSTDYGIVAKRIYRAVTGALGSVFRFVAEIPLAQSEYEDSLEDAELGEVLESEEWDLPPDDLRYILALPNGIMVGASRNRLCFSVQNRPHAWPIAWRLATDSDITGLGNVDTSVFVGTQTFVYTASGNTPDAYSMSKPGAPHACVSARSVAYLLGIGVVFAGPDGLMLVNGPTDVRNATDALFTRDQWQALDPATITGIAHDDIYFFFSSPGGIPESTVLSQSFIGDGDTVTGLTPEVAPAGFAWEDDGSSLITSANGAIEDDPATEGLNFADAFTPIERQDGTAMRMVAQSFTGSSGPRPDWAGFKVESALGYYVEVRFDPESSPSIIVLWSDESGAGSSEPSGRFVGPTGVDQQIDVTIEIFDTLLVVSGTVSGTIDVEMQNFTQIDSVEVQVRIGDTVRQAIETVQILQPSEAGDGEGRALDLKPTGFGLIELGMHASAVAREYESDALIMVLDEYEEPTGSLLPPDTASSIDADGLTLYEWSGSVTDMRYSWRGKLWLNPYPKAWAWVRVRAFDYEDLEVQFYADGVLLHQQLVTSARAFRLPMANAAEEIDWVAIGTSRVRTVELADDSEELT